MNTTPQGFHPENNLQGPYAFEALARCSPELQDYLFLKSDGSARMLDFSDPKAVRALNRAILLHDYQIHQWQLPEGFLCPAVPGRMDYLLHVRDFLNIHPGPHDPVMLDIGTGANGIYALLAAASLQWRIIATDVNPTALRNLQSILLHNPVLSSRIELRHQIDPANILEGIVKAQDRIALTVCNPPFYDSFQSAQLAHHKKHLTHTRRQLPTHPELRSTGGIGDELHYPGGEIGFVSTLIRESVRFQQQICWFTTLISKAASLRSLEPMLQAAGIADTCILPMKHGNKTSRILCWRFPG